MPTPVSNYVTIVNTLKSLGIYEKVCSNLEDLDISLQDILDNFLSEISDKIEDVLSQLDFEQIAYILSEMLSSSVGGVVSEWYDKIINEFWNGKIVGSISSMISSILLVIPGIDVYIQYSAVKSLYRYLIYRHNVLNILIQDLNLLTQIILSYMKLFSPIINEDINLQKAIKELTSALQYTSLTLSKTYQGKYILSSKDFDIVNNKIDKALNYITDNSNRVGKFILDAIHRKYNLKTKPPTFSDQFNPIYWIQYFENLNDEIINTFTGEEGKRIALLIAKELFPFFPRFLQLMLLQSRINLAISEVQKRTPILLGSSIFNKGLNTFGISLNLDLIGTSVESIYKNALSFFGIKSYKASENRFFSKEETKNLTLQDINTKIEYYENLILSMELSLGTIKEIANPYINLLESIQTSIKSVRSDIINADHTKLPEEKLLWISELTTIKGYIKSVNSDYAGLQVPLLNSSKNRSIKALDLSELIQKSDKKYKELQKTIIEFRKEKLPVKSGYSLSLSALNKLISNIAIVVSSNDSKNLVSEIKSIIFTYNEQIKLDIIEINKCKSYISVLENSIVFNDIRYTVDYYFNTMGSTSVFNELTNSLTSGDIGKIMLILGNSYTIIDDIEECLNSDLTNSVVSSISEFYDLNLKGKIDDIEQKLLSIKSEILNVNDLILNSKETLLNVDKNTLVEKPDYIIPKQANKLSAYYD